MQKILNDPLAFVDEMLDGVVLAHADQLRILDGSRGIVRVAAPVANKVGIATGGGSGHLPVFMGYVGEGLADGAAIGNVFASPSAEQMSTLKDTLKAQVGKDVQINTRVDPNLLGGLVVKVGSRMIDSSLRTKLNNLKVAMKGTA